MTEWQIKIELLRSEGFTLARIAEETGMSPGAVSDLAQARTAVPRHDNGERLEQLYRKVRRRARRKAS